MRRVYPADCWPGRDDEPVEYISLNESAVLPGVQDGYFVQDVPRARWRVAYRAARLAFRDRAAFHLPAEYRVTATARLGRIVSRALGDCPVTDARYARAIEGALDQRSRDHDWMRLYSALKSRTLQQRAA